MQRLRLANLSSDNVKEQRRWVRRDTTDTFTKWTGPTIWTRLRLTWRVNRGHLISSRPNTMLISLLIRVPLQFQTSRTWRTLQLSLVATHLVAPMLLPLLSNSTETTYTTQVWWSSQPLLTNQCKPSISRTESKHRWIRVIRLHWVKIWIKTLS